MRFTAPMCVSVNSNTLPNGVEDNHARLLVHGNGATMASKCVMLKQGKSRILVNCGESADFKGIADGVYATHISWDKVGGIPSVIYKASTAMREKMSLYGPHGLEHFVRASESFLWLSKKFILNVGDPNPTPQTVEDNFKVTCIPIRSKTKIVYNPPPVNKSLVRNQYATSDSTEVQLKKQSGLTLPVDLPARQFDFSTSNSYIFDSVGCKSWLFAECVKRGVKPGENMHKLWRGENITVDDGSVVRPEDVISSNTHLPIIVIDCPTKDFLDDLLRKNDYEKYYNSAVLMVHFTPTAVMHDNRYITWMQSFNKQTKHLIVNDSNEWDCSFKVLKKQKICRSIHPRFFPELRKSSTLKTIESMDESSANFTSIDGSVNVQAVPSEEWLLKWNDQLREFNLVEAQFGTDINLTTLDVTRVFESFEISCLPHEKKLSASAKTPPKFSPKNPRLTFLGTGSQASSAYRNASGILVQLSPDSSMLLDCGDGTMKQLATLFDDKHLMEVLTSLKCIYISHAHADHHAGLVGILLSIRKAWQSSRKQPQKLVCLLPAPIIRWVQFYHNNIEPILEHVVLINLVDLMSDNLGSIRELNQFLLKHFGMKQTKVCWAIHSIFSYCVSFEHAAGWQISYSGDTRYNPYFVEMGRHSDLLIHEATYGTGLNTMAKKAKHSTTDEAIRVGKEMRAKHVILTHFSRRYPIIPCLKDLKNTKNVAIAMDFLQVTLNDLHLLPKLHQDYEVVFDMYEQENIDRNVALQRRNS